MDAIHFFSEYLCLGGGGVRPNSTNSFGSAPDYTLMTYITFL